MEAYVPKSVAWRPKIGIHQGGGLQAGLDNFFGGRDKNIAAYNKCFHNLTRRLSEDPFASIDDISSESLLPPNNAVDLPMRELIVPRALSGHAVTPSGLGAVLDSNIPTDMQELANLMSEHATRAGFVLARDLQLSEEDFKALVQGLGDPVQHNYKSGKADLMKLDATREKGKVVVGRGALPLHTDGILLGKHPDLIVLYACKFDDKPGSGETFISDKLKAWEEMPHRRREILETKTFEYRIEEQKHYEGAPTGWYPIPTFCDLGRLRSLNLALQFGPGQERSWSVRVANVALAESDAILAELNPFFCNHATCISIAGRYIAPPELNLVSTLARTLQEVPTSRGFHVGLRTNTRIAGIDPEVRFVGRIRELIFDIYDTECCAHGKSMWVDKDAFTGFHVSEATHLLGKGIKYIWLQRHGLDVAISQEEKFEEQGVFAHEFHQYVVANQSILAAATQLWSDINRDIAFFAAQNPERVLPVKYEDLARDAEKTMGQIQTSLEADDSLEHIHDALKSSADFGKGDTKIYATKSVHESSVGRWRSLEPGTRQRLAPTANPMLLQLGYEEIQYIEAEAQEDIRQAFYDKIVAPMVNS